MLFHKIYADPLALIIPFLSRGPAHSESISSCRGFYGMFSFLEYFGKKYFELGLHCLYMSSKQVSGSKKRLEPL